MEFILEYNEEKGSFFHNTFSHEENTNGYKTISKTNCNEEFIFGKWLETEIGYKRGTKVRYVKMVDLWNRFKLVEKLFNN